MNNIFKKTLLLGTSIALSISLVLPFTASALTYTEIVQGQQYENHKGQVLGSITPSPDINADGIVNSVDVSILLGHMGQNYTPADLNSDGTVNTIDYSILSSWFFATSN